METRKDEDEMKKFAVEIGRGGGGAFAGLQKFC